MTAAGDRERRNVVARVGVVVGAAEVLQRVSRRVELVVEGERPILGRVHLLQEVAVLRRDLPGAHHDERDGALLGGLGAAHHVHVQLRDDPLPRHRGAVGEPPGSQQPALFGSVGDEEDRSPGALGPGAQGAGDFQERHRARSVVVRPVGDRVQPGRTLRSKVREDRCDPLPLLRRGLVAGAVRPHGPDHRVVRDERIVFGALGHRADVIVVRRQGDVLVAQVGIAAAKHGDHVARRVSGGGVLDLERSAERRAGGSDLERRRVRAEHGRGRRRRDDDSRLPLHGRGITHAGAALREARDRPCRVEVELRNGHAARRGEAAETGRGGHSPRRTARPGRIRGHGEHHELARRRRRIDPGGRIGDLAAVDGLGDCDRARRARQDHEVRHEVEGRLPHLDGRRLRGAQGSDRHRLEEGAVLARRLEPGPRELGGHVVGRLYVAQRAGHPTAHGVVGEREQPLAKAFGRDARGAGAFGLELLAGDGCREGERDEEREACGAGHGAFRVERTEESTRTGRARTPGPTCATP